MTTKKSVTWDNVPHGQVRKAMERLLKAFGSNALEATRRMNRNSSTVYAMAHLAIYGKPAPDGPLSKHELARLILGKDFISPEEVLDGGLEYPEDAYSQDYVVPSQQAEWLDALCWCRVNDMILMPAPPEQMNLFDVRKAHPRHLTSIIGSSKCGHEMSEYTKNHPWMAVSRFLPGSVGKRYHAQVSLLPQGTQVPHAAELAWCLATLFNLRNGDFARPHLRERKLFTDSMLNWRYRVVVSCEKGQSIYLCSESRWGWDNGLGLAGIRYFEL